MNTAPEGSVCYGEDCDSIHVDLKLIDGINNHTNFVMTRLTSFHLIGCMTTAEQLEYDDY